jgi:hypothetical protein
LTWLSVKNNQLAGTFRQHNCLECRYTSLPHAHYELPTVVVVVVVVVAVVAVVQVVLQVALQVMVQAKMHRRMCRTHLAHRSSGLQGVHDEESAGMQG